MTPHAKRRSRATLPALAALVALVATIGGACSDTPSTAPRDVLGDYVAIGASLTAGWTSDGLVYTEQSSSYPALMARANDATLRVPRIQAPGCVPPIVAPLYLGRRLTGSDAFAATRDSTCAGRFDDSVSAQVVAVPEATTYHALRFTDDSASHAGDLVVRRALPEILLAGYTQAAQATLTRPSLVTVELGFSELLRAVRTGRMLAATDAAYREDTAFTYVPAAVWQPVYDSLLVAVSSAQRGALLGVPSPVTLPALRRGTVLYAQRDSLLAFGVALAADCAGSANLVNLAKVAAAAARAARLGATQAVSCADVPNVADSVLTAADGATLLAVRDAMNARIEAAARERGWAYVAPPSATEAATYDARQHLAGVAGEPGLDGIFPAASGRVLLAVAVLRALNERYGLSLREPVTNVLELVR